MAKLLPKLLPRRWIFRTIALLLSCGVCLGWGLAKAIEPTATIEPAAVSTSETIGTVDIVPKGQQLGQSLYLESCATCHIAPPPAIMPTQTWQALIQDPQHYGTTIDPLKDPNRRLVWNYLKLYSRPIKEDESIPFRISSSRYFKALHPNVQMPKPLKLESCIQCHSSAQDFDFRNGLVEKP
jgi:hypothetical protein